MKKIISLLFVVTMLFACTVPAFAETQYQSFKASTTIDGSAIFDALILQKNVEVTIIGYHANATNKCNVEITNKGTLKLYDNSILKICGYCSLIGEDVYFFGGENNQIAVMEDGLINLSFHSSTYADMFEQLLKDNGVKYTRSGSHIVAGCFHSEWEDGVCTSCGIHCLHETYDNGACTVCGKVCENEFHNGKYTCPDCGMVVGTSATGSILSHGYPEIVYGIGGIAIGVVVTLLISRKKKVAVSSAAGEDENE